MKVKIMFICISITLMMSLFSCSDPVDYQIQIVNNTTYRIDKLEFSGSLTGPVVSIEPMSTSEPFNITYDEDFGDVIGNPEYLISITQYSDENGTYTNSMWRFFSLNQAKPGQTNVISVQLDPMSIFEHDIFQFIIN